MAIRFDCAIWAQYPWGTMGPNPSLAGHALVRQLGAIALVAAAGLLIGACGSSNSPSASSSPSPSPQAKLIPKVDACTLVTVDEASMTTGKTLANLGGASAAQVPGACLYASSDGTTTLVVFAQ